MTLLVLLGALAVLCVAALAATTVGVFGTAPREGLRDARPDRAPFGELPDGELRPEHVRSLRFSLAFRGYRMDHVDAALERLADELAARDARIAELGRSSPDFP